MNGGDFRSLQTSRREPACRVLPVTELARAGDERESKRRVSCSPSVLYLSGLPPEFPVGSTKKAY